MKIFKITFLFLIIAMQSAVGQESRYLVYDWNTTPAPWPLSKEDKANKEVSVLTHRIVQLEYDANDGKLYEYYLYHGRTYVNDKAGIAENNTVYISLDDVYEVVKAKARVILPNGKVIVQNMENLKKGYSQEMEADYNYFAFDGMEPGSEIELLYVVKKSPDLYGIIYTIQGENIKYNESLEIISPANLVIESKSYNGLPDMVTDTTLSPLNYLKVSIDTLRGMQPESYAYLDKNLGKIAYKLDKNTYSNLRNVVDYGKIARYTHENTYPEFSRNDLKAIKKIYDLAGLDEKKPADENIRLLENYLKKNFHFQKNYPDDLSNPKNILENKAYTELGALRIYTAICKNIGIKTQLVFTCDRTKNAFDKNFAIYNYLEKELLYFPEINLFLDPISLDSRLGLINPEYTHTDGMFVSSVSMGGFVTGIATFENIPAKLAKDNKTEMDIEVDFSTGLTSPKVHYVIKKYGTTMSSAQAFYDRISPERLPEIKKSFLELDDNFEVKNILVSNTNPEDIGQKPIVIEGDVTSQSFVQLAGNKALFRIGQLIGPQSELYSESKKERVQSVENLVRRAYDRSITFEVPEGYKLSNPEDLKMEIKYMNEEGKIQMCFISDYEQTGKIITVIIDEQYNQMELPANRFDEFSKVINAASDFNKIVLIFEKA